MFTRLRRTKLNIFRNKEGFWDMFLPVILLTIVLTSCATMKIPDYPKTPVDTYNNMMIKDGLHLSAQAMTDKADLKKYFGTDLFAHNIVPIHLIAENKSQSSSFVIAKDRMSFKHRSKMDSLTTGGQVDGKSSGGEAAIIGGSVSLIVAPVLAPVLIFSGFKAVSNSEVVKHNFAVKELQARTISPGKSIDGFVYFSFPEDYGSLKNWQLLVQVINLGNKGTQEFVLTLD